MDNKITKRRLSDFLAYEWIVMIVVCVAAIIVWELIYSIGSVKLTVGQNFWYYFDSSIYGNSTSLNQLMDDESALSYDVLSFDNEQLSSEYNVLSTRLYAYQGDVLITDCIGIDDAEKPIVRLKTHVDNDYGYSYDVLLKDAQNYLLENFMKDGLTAEQAFSAYNEHNFDSNKIEAVFRSRMKKDNRFRKETQIREGVYLETDRVEKLYKEVIDFAKLLSLKEQAPELFFNYTKYEQIVEYTDTDKEYWEEKVNTEIREGRADNVYALKVQALTQYNPDGTKTDPSKYFTVSGSDTSKDVCIMVFDFKAQQPHLQYETISFINTIVRDCSNILDQAAA